MTGAGGPTPADPVAVWAALVRGINVGGSGRMPMAGFRAMLAEAGLERPETHVQSGNAVFGSDRARQDLAAMIGAAMAARFGFQRDLVLRTAAEMAQAATHPFAGAAPETVHAFFLAQPCASVDGDLIATLAAPTERWSLAGDVFHLWAPDGIGRSRLADRLHRAVPGIVTARNHRTVRAVAAMMAARAADSTVP